MQDANLYKMTEMVAELRARSRDEVFYERAHSARLQLWLHTIRAGMIRVRRVIIHREGLLHHQKTLDRKAQRTLRHHLWEQKVAVHVLALDTSALFLFFAQRVATMSGAHKSYNDALRLLSAPSFRRAL